MDEIRAGEGMSLRKDNVDGTSLFARAVTPSDVDRGNWREAPEQERIDYLAAQEAEANKDEFDLMMDEMEAAIT